MSPIRPSFREGARLSAGQLNATVKYLRDSLRRFTLAPFSPGVAAGLTITASGSTFTINPGVAVDGRGRLLVLETPLVYTLAESGDLFLTGGGPPVAHFVPGATTLFVVRLEYRESGGTTDTLCEAGSTFGVQEGVQATFELADDRETSTEAFLQLFNEGCVDPWSDLDGVSTGSCAVQLGTVALLEEPPLLASMYFRQGMSARLSLIRSSLGVPSIAVGKLPIAGTAIDAVVFPVPAGGPVVQSTYVGPFAATFSTARFLPSAPHVFEFCGGSPPLPGGLAGVAAVSLELAAASTVVDRAGLPLTVQSGTPDVARVARALAPDFGDVIGLSAAAEYSSPFHPGKRIVPVAIAGLIRALVHSVAGVVQGSALVMEDTNTLTTSTGDQLVVARATRVVPVGETQEMFVWVVNPAARWGGTVP